MPEPGWGSTLATAARNLPGSWWDATKGTARALTVDLPDTVGAIGELGAGAYSKVEGALGARQKPKTKAREEATLDAAIGHYVKTYGSVAGFKKALAEDPIGPLMDIYGAVSGAAGMAGKVGALGRTARVAKAIEHTPQQAETIAKARELIAAEKAAAPPLRAVDTPAPSPKTAPEPAAPAPKNIVEQAKNLGMDSDSIPALNELKQLNVFHKDLMGKVQTRAAEAAALAREYHESGKLPFPVGTRFHTPHTREKGQPPHKVEGHFVDPKDPERYGYRTVQGDPDGDGDWSRGQLLVSNPNGAAKTGKTPEWFTENAAQWEPLGGMRAVEPPRAVETPEGLVVQPKAAAARTVPAAAEAGTIDDLRALLADPANNQPAEIANAHALETLGTKYDVDAPKPISSLEKQSGIGRAFGMAVEGSPEYKHALFERYGETMPELVEKTGAQNYDQLTEAAYRALNDEAKTQFDRLPVRTTYHGGELEYPVPSAMMRDVLARGNLNVFRGGDKHPFLSDIDPDTGLTSNEMFRAVHDYFGHVPQGNTFRAPGEEAAYASHAQMTPELARMALMSETRGQNSFVNYTPLNADIVGEMEGIKARLAEIAGAHRALAEGERPWTWRGKEAKEILDRGEDPIELKRQLRELGKQWRYAPQEPVLLPPEYLAANTKGGLPDYLRAISRPPPGTAVGSRGVHLSKSADLTRTDPAFYGSGHRGAEYESASAGVRGAPKQRTFFYTGPKGDIIPEKVVLAEGADVPYEGELSGLHPHADVIGLKALVNAYSRDGRSAENFREFERLLQEYGFKGFEGTLGTRNRTGAPQTAAVVYEPVPVRRIPKKPKHVGYAAGGLA